MPGRPFYTFHKVIGISDLIFGGVLRIERLVILLTSLLFRKYVAYIRMTKNQICYVYTHL